MSKRPALKSNLTVVAKPVEGKEEAMAPDRAAETIKFGNFNGLYFKPIYFKNLGWISIFNLGKPSQEKIYKVLIEKYLSLRTKIGTI